MEFERITIREEPHIAVLIAKVGDADLTVVEIAGKVAAKLAVGLLPEIDVEREQICRVSRHCQGAFGAITKRINRFALIGSVSFRTTRPLVHVSLASYNRIY